MLYTMQKSHVNNDEEGVNDDATLSSVLKTVEDFDEDK